MSAKAKSKDLSKKKRLLIVDDDQDLLDLISCFAKSAGYEYKVACDGEEAKKLLKRYTFSVVITDMIMPFCDGMELLQFVKKYTPETYVIVMTGYSDRYSYNDVIEAGATDFIEKPFKQDEFKAKLQRVFKEKHLMRELRVAKEAAESASKAKTTFINIMSHELRTPMNGILGFISILNDTGLTPKQREYFGLVGESADRLMNLINQLLDFSMIDASSKDLSPVCFNVKDALVSFLEPFESRAKDAGLTLTFTVEDALLGKTFLGEMVVIGQIINNLLDNAIKFSDSGEVILSAVEGKKSGDEVVVRFTVKDEGLGIAKDKLDVIFEDFTQAEGYLTRKHEGAGLGLAICKKLVALLGGEIWAESKLGEGSAFHVILKLGLGWK